MMIKRFVSNKRQAPESINSYTVISEVSWVGLSNAKPNITTILKTHNHI